MAVELCCQYLKEVINKNKKVSYKNLLEEKNLQYNCFLNKNYSNEKILDVYKNNLSNLEKILKHIYAEGIRGFRVSSNLLPLFDLVEESIKNNSYVISTLKRIGEFVLDKKIRLTTHPDQFVVLSSKNQIVIKNSINILKYHAWIFDQMKLPQSTFFSINIHGGVKGESDKLIQTILNLPENIKNRLTLENDERSYNVIDLQEIYKQTKTPIVFDTHHHKFNNGGLSINEGMDLSISTWGEIKPLTHLSNSFPEFVDNGSFSDKRKHSDYVHYIPDYQLELNNKNIIDVSFEFKMKNLAIFKAVKDFGVQLF